MADRQVGDIGTLVGREPERRLLIEALQGAARGTGRSLFISGEAGIGKTRLANYALQEADRRGFYTLSGRSPPLARDLGYAPIIQAFGGWLRNQPPPRRSKLTRGLSSLSVLFDDLDLAPPDYGADPALEKTRVFDAVLRLLGRIASEAPVAFFFDDLNWADPASLELLLYLSHELPGVPVLLVATYRPEEETAFRPGFRVLREALLRNAPSRDLLLERLSSKEIKALLTEQLGGEPSNSLADLLAERSRGVPLFVEGLVRWLRVGDRLVEYQGRWDLSQPEDIGLPPLVRDTILGRLDRLSPMARETLEVIAVAGEAPLHMLQAVAPGPLGEGLTTLLQAGLIVEEVEGAFPTYRLEHPLVHEVTYEEIAPSRRSRVHMALAEAHQSTGDRITAATHYVAAGPRADEEPILETLVAAGKESLGRYADEQAARFFQAALAPARSSRPQILDRVLIGLGQARYRLGQLSGAIEVWRSALESEHDVDDPVRQAHIHRLIASAESERGAYEAAQQEIEAGLSVLQDLPPSEERLELLWVKGVTAARRPDLEAMKRIADPLRLEAAMLGTLRAGMVGGVSRASEHLHKGQYHLVTETLEGLEGPAQRLGDATSLRRVYDLKGMMAAALGDLEGLRAANRRSLDLGRRVGVPGWNHRLNTSQFLEAYLSGEWDRAREVLREAAITAEKVNNPRTVPVVSALEAMLATFQGEFQKATDHLETGRSLLPVGVLARNPAGMMLDLVTALLALEQDNPAEALAVIEPIDPHLEAILPPWGVIALAEAAVGAERPDTARRAITRLQASGPEGAFPVAMAERLLGLVETFEGRIDRGVGRLFRARQLLQKLGMPFESARVLIEAGEVMVQAAPDRLESFIGELSLAHEVVARLGARRCEERVGALLDKAGVPVSVGEVPAEPELTPRQMEVAELVAKGLSNAEIAEDLFISIRTVTSHLDHIYTRLGINSRAALATYVVEIRHAGQPSGI